MVASANNPADLDDSLRPLPSQEEIRERSAEIRKQWSDAVRRRRRCDAMSFHSTIQLIRMADVVTAGEDN